MNWFVEFLKLALLACERGPYLVLVVLYAHALAAATMLVVAVVKDGRLATWRRHARMFAVAGSALAMVAIRMASDHFLPL